MASNRDAFFDDGIIEREEHSQTHHRSPSPPIPTVRKRLSTDADESIEDPTQTPRSPPLRMQPETLTTQPNIIHEEISVHESKASSRRSSKTDSFESDIDDDDDDDTGKKEIERENIPVKEATVESITRSTADIDIQTDRVVQHDESIQTEFMNMETIPKLTPRKVAILSESKHLRTPLVKALLDQDITSALPIISFCRPFSMTSHLNDIILAMPRHLMIINNHNSVSVHPWPQPEQSTSTILECFWCSFLYKLLITTLEDNRLSIHDFISVIDTIKLRGQPLSIKQQNYQSKPSDSSILLPPSSRYQPIPAVWSQTRFTKSNALGIYYCYISERHYSTMLARIDHNTRQHIKAIDCTGGSLNNHASVCALGLSEERVAVILTNLIMTIYDAESLIGLKQINLSRSNSYNIRGVSAVIYLWKTWLIFDPIENKVVGVGNRKRQFVKMLPEQPINACSMDNGTLALWLGYPGALLYYRISE